MRKLAMAMVLLAFMGCSSENEPRNMEDYQYNPSEYNSLDPVWITEEIQQRETKTSEILFIIDDSLSMSEDQFRLSEEMPYMIQSLQDANLDYRVAVTTTSWSDFDKEKTNFIRIGGMTQKWIDRNTPDPITTFSNLTMVGTNGDQIEKGIYSLYVSLRHKKNQNFYRDDSPLHIILVSDEPDGTVYGTDISEKRDVWEALEDHKRRADLVTFTSIVMSEEDKSCKGRWPVDIDPSDYLEITNRYPGIGVNICGEWDDAIDTITGDILRLNSAFPLSYIPEPGHINVYVRKDDVTIQYQENKNWYFDAKTNSVVFYKIIHDPGSVIILEYMTADSASELEE